MDGLGLQELETMAQHARLLVGGNLLKLPFWCCMKQPMLSEFKTFIELAPLRKYQKQCC